MGSPSDSISSAAMGKACEYVRRYPKFFHLLHVGDPSGTELLAKFMAEPKVLKFLGRRARITRHHEIAVDLIDKADDYVHQGVQAERLMKTYVEQFESGKLQGLARTRFAVHRAVFSLGIYQGAPILGALRYIAALVEAQSGIAVHPRTISRHLLALTHDGLIHYEPGRRGMQRVPNDLPRVDAGKISLDQPTDPSRDLDPEVVLGLALTSSQRLALSDYIAKARKRNEAIRAKHRQRKEAEYAERCKRAELERDHP